MFSKCVSCVVLVALASVALLPMMNCSIGEQLDSMTDKMTDAAKSAFNSGKEFFKSSVDKVTDLFAGTKEELLTKVGKVKALLTGVKAGKSELEKVATDEQKAALANTDKHLSKVTAYENELKDSADSAFDEKKKKWEDMMNGDMGKDVMMLGKMASAQSKLSPAGVLSVLTVALVAAALAR